MHYVLLFRNQSNRSCILLLRWHMISSWTFVTAISEEPVSSYVRSQRDWNGLEPGQPQQDNLNKSFEKTHEN